VTQHTTAQDLSLLYKVVVFFGSPPKFQISLVMFEKWKIKQRLANVWITATCSASCLTMGMKARIECAFSAYHTSDMLLSAGVYLSLFLRKEVFTRRRPRSGDESLFAPVEAQAIGEKENGVWGVGGSALTEAVAGEVKESRGVGGSAFISKDTQLVEVALTFSAVRWEVMRDSVHDSGEEAGSLLIRMDKGGEDTGAETGTWKECSAVALSSLTGTSAERSVAALSSLTGTSAERSVAALSSMFSSKHTVTAKINQKSEAFVRNKW
jgi:hypothetical protein